MDRLRRIIIHKSEGGYMFSIKDLGYPYTDAAPVNKVVPNGPADCAGLRPGDGLVAINSNLVKGKNHQDLCNIIKSCQDISLELAIIENQFVTGGSLLSKNKISYEEEIRNTNNTTPLSIDETELEDQNISEEVSPQIATKEIIDDRKSPLIFRKKAYVIDPLEVSKRPFNSNMELNSENMSENCNEHESRQTKSDNRFYNIQPKINFKPAKPLSAINNQIFSHDNNGTVNSSSSISLHHKNQPVIHYKSNLNKNSVTHSLENKYKSASQITFSTKNSVTTAVSATNNSVTNNNYGLNDRSRLLYHQAYSKNNRTNSTAGSTNKKAYKSPLSFDLCSTSNSQIEQKKQQQNEEQDNVTEGRRGSTPIISNRFESNKKSSSDNASKRSDRFSQSSMASNNELNRIATTNSQPLYGNSGESSSKVSHQSPQLQLNRVGGLVRSSVTTGSTSITTPISLELENDEFDADVKNDFLLDNGNLDDSSSILIEETVIPTEFKNSYQSPQLIAETVDSNKDLSDTKLFSSRGKFRHFYCSPIPYKSQKIYSPDVTDQGKDKSEFDENDDTKDKRSPRAKLSDDICLEDLHFEEFENRHQVVSNVVVQSFPPNGNEENKNSRHTKSQSQIPVELEDSTGCPEDSATTPTSRHLKKLKSIFGDSYRARSKTLDSDRKLKEEGEIDHTTTTEVITVMVKWINYEGKSQKSSWKQFVMNVENESCIVFTREKMQTYLTSASLEEVSMTLNIKNSSVEEESEKRGRKNTIRITQPASQTECLVEFSDKALANKWLLLLQDKAKSEKEDKSARSASFKERHSLTVPNLYSKETLSVQSQFTKSKSKSKDESVPSNVSHSSPSTAAGISTPSSKGVIHQAMSRVKNLKYKFSSTPSGTDFERQQEEWFNRTSNASTVGAAPSSTGSGSGSNPGFGGGSTGTGNSARLSRSFPTSNSYTEEIHSWGADGSGTGSSHQQDKITSGNSNSVSIDYMQHHSIDGFNPPNQLPLHLWPRSIVSPFIPLVVELCVSIIEKFGMNLVGLYRVSGNKIALDTIWAELRKSVSEIDVTNDKWNDLHAISGVLKSYFRNLPDGLFPKELYSDIIGVCRLHEHHRERRLLSLQRILSIMDVATDHPEYRHHRETLRYLVEHLSRVASRESINKMTARNLAVVFAPTLMQPPHETSENLVNDYKYKIQLVETLIKYHKWLFSPTFESACNIPPDLDDDNALYNPEDSTVIPYDISDSTPSDLTDARPLVSDILERVQKSQTYTGITDNSQDISRQMTLAELSKEAHKMDAEHIGYKEVDIDEECERRLSNKEKMERLRNTTHKITFECTNELEDLEVLEEGCRHEQERFQVAVEKLDKEILDVSHFQHNSSNSRLSTAAAATATTEAVNTTSTAAASLETGTNLLASFGKALINTGSNDNIEESSPITDTKNESSIND